MDLNMMMRDQARNGLQTQLDTAVTNGDTVTARKLADDIAKLDVATAPKTETAAYGDKEIKAALEAKADWFGIDPRRSGAAVRLGKDMNIKKFATADLFADALIKAINEEFKPAGAAPAAGEGEGGEGEGGEGEGGEGEGGEGVAAKPAKQRATDGPKDGDLGRGTGKAAKSGPWTKLADAPADVQKEIKRQADRFIPANAKKETRETYTTSALASHYRQHQQTKGKK